MEITPVDQRDIDSGMFERTGRVESPEPSADNDDARPHVFRLCPSHYSEQRRVFVRQTDRAQSTVQENMARPTDSHPAAVARHLIIEGHKTPVYVGDAGR